MPVDLSIPLTGKKKTVKDHIISILSNEWPLSSRKIYNILTKKYNLAVSYQAVHKAIKELINEGIIIREGKELQLNLEWINEVKDSVILLEQSYNDGKMSEQNSFMRGYERAKSDILDISNMFLVDGERILKRNEIKKNTLDIWAAAKKYIKVVSLTGFPWIPEPKIIESVIGSGVDFKLILIKPNSFSLKHLILMETLFSKARGFVIPRVEKLESFWEKEINSQIGQTVNILDGIIGTENIRFYNKPLFWKGTIIDGNMSQYVFYDIPRKTVPFRYTENPKITAYFEKFYFDEMWKNGKRVGL